MKRLGSTALVLCAALFFAATAGAQPSPAAQKALAFLNDRYRAPLGLPPIVWSDTLAQAAQNHVNYWKLNGYSGHEEQSGLPGFTGIEPWDRCIAVGAPGCGEDAYPATDLADAMTGWLDAPYHGAPLLEATTIGLGTLASAGTVADMSGQIPGSWLYGGDGRYLFTAAGDPAAPLNTPGSAFKLWPYDRASAVPSVWTGGEIPDPLAAYTGNPADIGPVFYVASPSPPLLRLSDARGVELPLLAPGAVASVLGGPSLDPHDQSGFYAVLAGRRLAPGSSYTLSLAAAGHSFTVHFETAGHKLPVGASLFCDDQTVAHELTAASLSARSVSRARLGALTLHYTTNCGATFSVMLFHGREMLTSYDHDLAVGGRHTVSFRQLFGAKPLAAGHYWLQLIADASERDLHFTVSR